MVADEAEREIGLWAMADLATPMAVRVAATLRIADLITQGLRTARELARASNAQADALDRVLRHLAKVGVLNRDESGVYSLTARGEGCVMITPPACTPCWTSRARSVAPTCLSSSCWTPCGQARPPSHCSSAAPSGTTCQRNLPALRRTTCRWAPTSRPTHRPSCLPTTGDRCDTWSTSEAVTVHW